MIRIAICDDEPYMLDEVTALLSKYMEEKNVTGKISRFTSGRELLECGGDFDIMFLDIQMVEPNGLETARQLRKQGYLGLLIFITVLKESVFDSFEFQTFDYLVKPIEESRFRSTMERAVKVLEQEAAKSIIVQTSNICQVISLSQIVYCEVLGRKIYVHLQGGETVDFYDKMENLEQRVDRRFFRCHRSYLVNLDYVRGHRTGSAALSDGVEIPVSRLRDKAFVQALLVHMKERRC